MTEKPDYEAAYWYAVRVLGHQVWRTHDYKPEACAGCADAEALMNAPARATLKEGRQ